MSSKGTARCDTQSNIVLFQPKLPPVAQTCQFVPLNAQTKSLRYKTFAVHERFLLKNGVCIREI